MKKSAALLLIVLTGSLCFFIPNSYSTTVEVNVSNFSFSPNNVNINPGDTVKWIFLSGSHTTTSGTNCTPDGKWDSGFISSGGSFSHQFNDPGTYPYYCTPHCSFGMVGTVTVNAVSDTSAPTVTSFTIPTIASTLQVTIILLEATDNVGVTGFMVTESSTAPKASDSGWSATAPASYTFATEGNKTLYAWAKDAAGNVSPSLSASVSVGPNTGSISGRAAINIAGHSDLSVANATVTLLGTSYSATTDNNGDFTLSDIPFGNYSMVVTAPNLNPLSQEVSLSTQNLQVSIPLMTVSQTECLKGDANGNNRLELDDVIYILQILSGMR